MRNPLAVTEQWLAFPISGFGLCDAPEEEIPVVTLRHVGVEGRNEENAKDNKGEDPLKNESFDVELLECQREHQHAQCISEGVVIQMCNVGLSK